MLIREIKSSAKSLGYIKTKMKYQLRMIHGRMIYLYQVWTKELNEMQIELSKSKDKT
jgi:hypothetical protein